MDFVDSVLVRLADPTTQADVLGEDAMQHLVEATFDTEAMTLAAPFTPLFDELRLGRPAEPLLAVDGELRGAGGTSRTEVQLRLRGLDRHPPVRMDALWTGAVVARTSTPGDTIASVRLDPVTGTPTAGTLRVRYSPAAPPQPGTSVLPIAVVVLVRDTGSSVSTLLAESHVARAAAAELGLVAPDDPRVPRRRHTTVLWLVPAAVFDDTDWPGGDSGTPAERRRARARRAASWLAAEGIALGPVG